MHEEHKPEPVPDELVKLGYDDRDVKLGPLVKALIALGVFLVGAQVVSYLVFVVMKPPVEPKLGAAVQTGLPPGPLLQVHPKKDIHVLRQAENARLHSYGVDATTGQAHIPIERAMDLVAAEGLPAGTPSVTKAQVAPKPVPPAPGSPPFIEEHKPAVPAIGRPR